MRVALWGVRGSVPTPGPRHARYGGNTSCVEVLLADGTRIVLDAGTGIRELGGDIDPGNGDIHILLTHLHVDHVIGLMFFAPLFFPDANVKIWGPPGRATDLRRRLRRYISRPLAPLEIRDLPANVSFCEPPPHEFQIGSARVSAEMVVHHGPTLGYRITDEGSTLCYLPDHEPALGVDVMRSDRRWISGQRLAHGVDLLLHDAQYTDEEYTATQGWGHSTIDHALDFAERSEAGQVVLFHHDPAHTDERLDEMGDAAALNWSDRGAPGLLSMAAEGARVTL